VFTEFLITAKPYSDGIFEWLQEESLRYRSLHRNAPLLCDPV